MPSPNLRLLGLHRSPLMASNLLWLLLLISVTGCRPDRRSHGANDSQATPAHPEVEAQAAAQPVPEGPSASLLDNEFAELQRNAQGTVRLIQITEINRDSLPNLQEDYEFYSEDLVRYEHGVVVVSERHSEDRQYEDDSPFEDFELANESVGSIVTTARLADCKMFVRYVVIYEGTGREGESVQWYGFQDLNGQFAADFVQPMNEVTYDPNQDVPPFAIWLEQLRLGPQSTIRFRVKATDTPAVIQLNDATFALAKGASTNLSTLEQTLNITRLPLLAADLFNDEYSAPDDDVIFPGDTFADVTLSTQMEAIDLGDVPLYIETIQPQPGAIQ